MYELGTDINRDWNFNENGDLIIVSDEENLRQSIQNRLTCILGSMDLYYEEYGSMMMNYMGNPSTQEVLEFLKIEIKNSLKQDIRTQENEVELEYTNTNELKINITITFDDVDLSTSLVIDENREVNIIGD